MYTFICIDAEMEPHGIHKQMVPDCFSVISAYGLKGIFSGRCKGQILSVGYLLGMSRQKSEQSETISCTRHFFAQMRGFRLRFRLCAM